MITYLKGLLVESLPTQAVIEVNGVGYEVSIPVSSFDKLPAAGNEVKLLTYLAIREDAHVLYGFYTAAERGLFRLLLSVSGVGPRLALNVLSGMAPSLFRAAVATGDVKALSRISGVGKKTAERIVVELRDKLGKTTTTDSGQGLVPVLPEDRKVADAVLALVALDFRQQDAHDAVRAALVSLGSAATVEELVRVALKKRN